MTVWILVLHIAVLGYWLGSELVINSTYRYVSYSGAMPFAERQRLMDHVMVVDQHVRYALVLQAMLGTMLAASYGLVPGGDRIVAIAGAIGIAWLAFVEAVHRIIEIVGTTFNAATGDILVGDFGLPAGFDLRGSGSRLSEASPQPRDAQGNSLSDEQLKGSVQEQLNAQGQAAAKDFFARASGRRGG